MWPLWLAVSSVRWTTIHRSVTGSARPLWLGLAVRQARGFRPRVLIVPAGAAPVAGGDAAASLAWFRALGPPLHDGGMAGAAGAGHRLRGR
jgi:hypothetical protein